MPQCSNPIKIDHDLMAASTAYDVGVNDALIGSVQDGGTEFYHAKEHARRRGFDSWADFVRACRREVSK